MVVLLDNTTDVNSNLTSSPGTQVARYTVPANVQVKIESVVATIANGSTSAITPELTIVDQTGVVIARKRQLRTMPAGDSGTATWALRLDDDGAGSTAAATLDDLILALPGLAAFWKLNESAGTVALDWSGNGHTMNASPTAPTWAQPAGPPGQQTAEWLLDPNTRMVTSMTGFTNNFTAGIWINVTAHTALGTEVLGQGTGGYHGAAGGWAIVVHLLGGAGFDKFAVGSTGVLIDANAAFSTNTWYFLVAVRDAGTFKLYVNGVLQSATTGTTPAPVDGTNTWLGNDNFAGHTTYLRDALLSYAFIANSVVSAADIAAMYLSV